RHAERVRALERRERSKIRIAAQRFFDRIGAVARTALCFRHSRPHFRHDPKYPTEMFACSRCDATTGARFDRCPSCGAYSSCVRTKAKRARTLRLSDVPPDDRARILVRKDWDTALGGPG